MFTAANKMPKGQRGFSLLEVVAALVIFALAVTALANVFFFQSSRSIEPLFQIRAAKLGEALMDEAMGKRYAENTPIGGVPACADAVACGEGSFGPDGESRDLFDDVDDYHSFCESNNGGQPFAVQDVLGNAPGSNNRLADFAGFRMSICIAFDGNYNAAPNDGSASEFQAKLITVRVYPPQNVGADTAIEFNAYRSNF
jgi:MSHA pilin protein MshD